MTGGSFDVRRTALAWVALLDERSFKPGAATFDQRPRSSLPIGLRLVQAPRWPAPLVSPHFSY